MNIYTLYVEDDRYSVPTLLTAEQLCDEQVLNYAAEHLRSSEHYRAVDIWEDDRLVGRLTRT